MTDFTFDIAAFRAAYPAFSDNVQFSDATLQGFWNTAICYLSPTDYSQTASPFCGWISSLLLALSGASRLLALNQLTAHFAALSVIIAGGQIPGLVQAATIDKINVTLTPPPLKNQWQWWLSLTPYGQQLFALLQVASVGGFYVGGFPERAAFRRAGIGF